MRTEAAQALTRHLQVQQAHRAKHVGLAHQIKMGLARHLPAFRRYVGREEQWRYKGPDAGKLREWLAVSREQEGLDGLSRIVDVALVFSRRSSVAGFDSRARACVGVHARVLSIFVSVDVVQRIRPMWQGGARAQ